MRKTDGKISATCLGTLRSILLVLLAVGFAFGQAPASDATASPISTDRPAVTDSSVVVPSGSIQVENGFADTVSQGQRTLDGPETSAQLPWSRSLSANWTAAGMLSVHGPTEDGHRRVTGETTFLVDRQLTKKCDAFVEYVGDFPEYGGPGHLMHFGSAWKLTANQQVDVHFGVGVSSAAVDHLIGAGYSFRFAAFRH
jgi:hypothetical protein